LARFFQAINKHRKALDIAIEENFAGRLDQAEWRRAFQSDEPRDANRGRSRFDSGPGQFACKSMSVQAKDYRPPGKIYRIAAS
jgi:hypothetical protein